MFQKKSFFPSVTVLNVSFEISSDDKKRHVDTKNVEIYYRTIQASEVNDRRSD